MSATLDYTEVQKNTGTNTAPLLLAGALGTATVTLLGGVHYFVAVVAAVVLTSMPRENSESDIAPPTVLDVQPEPTAEPQETAPKSDTPTSKLPDPVTPPRSEPTSAKQKEPKKVTQPPEAPKRARTSKPAPIKGDTSAPSEPKPEIPKDTSVAPQPEAPLQDKAPLETEARKASLTEPVPRRRPLRDSSDHQI